MPITITLTGESAEQILNDLTTLAIGPGAQLLERINVFNARVEAAAPAAFPAFEGVAKPEKPKRERKAAPAPAPADAPAPQPAAAEEAPPAATTAPAGPVTTDTVPAAAVTAPATPTFASRKDADDAVRAGLRSYVDRIATGPSQEERDTAYGKAMEKLNLFAPKIGDLKDGQHALLLQELAK